MFDKIAVFLKGRALGESRLSLAEKLALNLPTTTLLSIEDNAPIYAGHTIWNRHNEKIDGNSISGEKFRAQEEWVIKRDTRVAMIFDEEASTILRQRELHKEQH